MKSQNVDYRARMREAVLARRNGELSEHRSLLAQGVGPLRYRLAPTGCMR